MMNNKNKVYQLEGGHLHDENGGRLLHEWPLLCFGGLHPVTEAHWLPTFWKHLFLKTLFFPKSCQWWWSQKRCEDTFDITLSSLILNECTFLPTMCTPEGHNMSIMMISQMWMLNSRRRSAARRTCLHSIHSAKTELSALSDLFVVFISRNTRMT